MLHPFPNVRVTESSDGGFGAAETIKICHLPQSGKGQVDQGKRLMEFSPVYVMLALKSRSKDMVSIPGILHCKRRKSWCLSNWLDQAEDVRHRRCRLVQIHPEGTKVSKGN